MTEAFGRRMDMVKGTANVLVGKKRALRDRNRRMSGRQEDGEIKVSEGVGEGSSRGRVGERGSLEREGG